MAVLRTGSTVDDMLVASEDYVDAKFNQVKFGLDVVQVTGELTDKAMSQKASTETFMQMSNDLSDVSSPVRARANLGLGNASMATIGSTLGTVAAGDDFRFMFSLPQVLVH